MLENKWISHLFQNEDMLKMEHLQRIEDANLGLGWLYYGLIRIIRPKTAVVVGSYRGFAPMVIAKALKDNGEGGEVLFIDPSLVDDFWKDENKVQKHFDSFGIQNIRHFLMTTQEFVASAAYSDLKEIGLVFVDGYHTKEQARIDYDAFKHKLMTAGMTLFHDSIRTKVSMMYGDDRRYRHSVVDFMTELRQDASLEVFTLPFAAGITMVQKSRQEQPGAAIVPVRSSLLSYLFSR